MLYAPTPSLYTRLLVKKKHVGLLSYIRSIASAECHACIVGSSSLVLVVDLPNYLCFPIVIFTIAICTHCLCYSCNNNNIVQEVKLLSCISLRFTKKKLFFYRSLKMQTGFVIKFLGGLYPILMFVSFKWSYILIFYNIHFWKSC